MNSNLDIEYKILPYENFSENEEFYFDEIIFDVDSKLDLLSSNADKFDYLLAIASGLLCGLLDIIWVGDFDLEKGQWSCQRKRRIITLKSGVTLTFISGFIFLIKWKVNLT